jgi:hypothetical protein
MAHGRGLDGAPAEQADFMAFFESAPASIWLSIAIS